MADNNVFTAIGLMSGTSLDGVDAALMNTDGEDVIDAGEAVHYPYPRMTKVLVRRAIKAALEGRSSSDEISEAIDAVTTAHIVAVRKLMEKTRMSHKEIDVIGLHGQTILHRPSVTKDAPGRTWQIGSGHILAEELRIDVVDNFRARDVSMGGEGAPLAPVYHAALVRKYAPDETVCVLNIGGVSNTTWVPAGGDVKEMIAFDCGPGNGLVDEWVHRKTGEHMDTDGKLAATGKVDEEALRLMLLNPYLRRAAPKSLDRYDFKTDAVKKLSLKDGAATLTAFTAACIEKSVSLLPSPPDGWVVTGGGRHNPVLMAHLKDMLLQEVITAEEAGWRGDDLEAECFAYLAVRSLRKLPISFPKTTRAPHALSGGVYHRAPI